MIFSLEFLQARHGDCLILHYGKSEPETQIIVIDGGPSSNYKHYLRPRLVDIKSALSPDDPLEISMLMVSHLDDDHANGIVDLTEEVKTDPSLFAIPLLWCNTFDNIVGNDQVAKATANVVGGHIASTNGIANAAGLPNDQAAVIASVDQGRNILANAEAMGTDVNWPFKKKAKMPKLVRGDQALGEITFNGLKINVVHPDEKKLEKLQKEWDKKLEEFAEKGDESIIFAALKDKDTSPYNLSSIVCLIEFEGKTILFTGDARSGDVLNGLEANGLLDSDGRMHVNILKMPHHGSERNMSEEFLQRITADHYVISADGNYDNPDESVIYGIAQVNRNSPKVKLHLTNREGKKDLGKKLDTLLQTLVDEGNKMKIVFPKKNKDSSVINLLETLTY